MRYCGLPKIMSDLEALFALVNLCLPRRRMAVVA